MSLSIPLRSAILLPLFITSQQVTTSSAVDNFSCVLVLFVKAAGREDTAAFVVNVSFTSDVCELLIRDLVSTGTVTAVATAVASAVVVVDGVRNISVAIISVVSLSKLLVDPSNVVVEVGSVPLLVSMVTDCTEGSLVGIDDNSDDKSAVER